SLAVEVYRDLSRLRTRSLWREGISRSERSDQRDVGIKGPKLLSHRVFGAKFLPARKRKSVRIRRLLRGFLPWSDLGERLREARLRNLGVIVRLQAQPPSIGEPEEAAQPQIGVRGDGAPAGDDLADALRGHTDLLRQPVVAHAQGLEELL